MVKQVKHLVYKEGKIDIHGRLSQYQRSLQKLESDEHMAPENRDLILEFVRDCSLGKTIRKGMKKKIGPARCQKYISILSRLSEEFGKSFALIEQADMERVVMKLEDGRVLSRGGKPLSIETRADYKKTIKKFWKWKDGNNSSYPDLVEWIDVSVKPKEVPALSREDVEYLASSTPSVKLKALIMVLFDSGARIEELLNVRLTDEHLAWKKETECYAIRLEFSKTKPRTVSLPLSSKHLKSWLDVHPNKVNPASQLFPMRYDAIRTALHRLASRTLRKRVTPHILRHSSATYYANLLNHQQLCKRYGWTMNSDQVNRYIDRAGIVEEETVRIIREHERDGQRRENAQLRSELAILKAGGNQQGGGPEPDQSSEGILSFLTKVINRQDEMAKVIEGIAGHSFDTVIEGEPLGEDVSK